MALGLAFIQVGSLPGPAFADDAARPGFSIRCGLSNAGFLLAFAPPGGVSSGDDDPSGDERQVTLKRAGYPDRVLKAPPALYEVPSDVTAARAGICSDASDPSGASKVTAYPAGARRVMLFLMSDELARGQHVIVFLLDAKSGELLDVRDVGWSMRQTLGVLPSGSGYRVRIFKRDTPGLVCDCDATVQEAWKRIGVRDGKIATRWLPGR